jgi:signal transduction histidine kinase
MARRRSLAERVVWAVTATVALLVGLQSVLAFAAMHAQEDELSETMLQREVQQIVAHILQPGLTPTGTLIDSTRVSAWLTRDGAGAEAMPAALRELAPGLYHFDPDGKSLHVAVTDTEDGRLTVLLDATTAEDRVDRFAYTLLALWLVCVAATVAIARGVAAIAVGPIVAATRTIARSAPDQPLGADGHRDEAGVLMETFNRFRDRVDDMVEREREFAANLDHEIRTPLTTIRTDAELVGLEGALAPAQRQRLARIVASVDEIIATTESTLSYSAGRFAGAETIDLRDFLLAASAAMADRAAARDLRVVVDVGAGEHVVADRQALLTIVRNLIRNAIEHAAPATLRIGGDRHGLLVSDDGPGIAPARLVHMFERPGGDEARVDAGGARGGRVRGLGLAIAKRLSDLQGWRLEVRSPIADGRGTAFTLDFAGALQAPPA